MATSVFEIIGPIMIGPSSSHTAGMARIGNMANQIAGGQVVSVALALSPKLKATYVGHRTDAALIGGAIGLGESDPRLRSAIDLAHQQGVDTSVDFLAEGQHPQNTALLTLGCRDGRVTTVLGTSIGGGSIEISAVDGASLQVAPDAFNLLLWSDSPLPDQAISGLKILSAQSAGGREGQVTCLTFAQEPNQAAQAALSALSCVRRVSLVRPVLPYGVTLDTVRPCNSCDAVCRIAKEEDVTLSEVAIRYEMSRSGFSRQQVRRQMHSHLAQLRRSVEEGKKGQAMLYGLTSGRDGARMLQAIVDGKTISGGIVPEVVNLAYILLGDKLAEGRTLENLGLSPETTVADILHICRS